MQRWRCNLFYRGYFLYLRLHLAEGSFIEGARTTGVEGVDGVSCFTGAGCAGAGCGAG